MTVTLSGVRVVLTRPEGSSTELFDALVEAGADVTNVALIRIGPPTDGGAALTRAADSMSDVEWVIVTSAHGAQSIRSALHQSHSVPKIAAVGAATAEAVGRPIDFVPSRATAHCLATEFPHGSGRVLVVGAQEPSIDFASELGAKGWVVEVVAGYATTSELVDQQDRRVVMGADVVVFASGSAVRSFVEQRLHGPSSRFVALGPSTRHAMVDAGLTVAAMANSPSPRDVVVAVGEAMGRTSP